MFEENDKHIIKTMLAEQLQEDVRLVFFTCEKPGTHAAVPIEQRPDDLCPEVYELLNALTELSSKLHLETYVLDEAPELAKGYGIARTPAVALVNGHDARIRQYGLPIGYQFTAFLESLLHVSRGSGELLPVTQQHLAQVRWPVHIEVFSTPNCPFCGVAANIAHQFALHNAHIRADAINAMEFPEQVDTYRIRAVPHIAINGKHHFVGAKSEERLLHYVYEALIAEGKPLSLEGLPAIPGEA